MKNILLSLLVTMLVAIAVRADDRPNILFIFSDDHAAHAISAYGSKINKTPNIDRIAREGVSFTNAFVTRRLAAEVGADFEVRAAFIETPTLSVRPLVQRYQRLASDRWVYADDEYGRFEFGTDAGGVAVDYEQLAERV